MGLREEYCLRLHCRLLFVCIKQKGMIFSFASNFAKHSHQKSSKYATTGENIMTIWDLLFLYAIARLFS
jgi:hypothetical protein